MSSPVFRRDQFSDLYGANMLPVLEELFRATIEMAAPKRDQLFKTESTERDIWQYSETHDLEQFKEISEGTDYTYVRPKQGADKTFTIKKFGLGVSISEEAIADGKFDEVANMLRHLGRAAIETQEVSAMNVINGAFDSTTVASGDFLVDASISLPSGSTYRNRLATDADLSVTSLDAMLSDFETEFVSDGGIILAPKPEILLVHPDNKRLARELIGSELKPETADNNMNSFRQDGLRVISSPHLTDADAWFLLANPSDNPLRIINRQGIQTRAAAPNSIGFHNDSLLWKCSYREQVGAVNNYGIMGTSGA